MGCKLLAHFICAYLTTLKPRLYQGNKLPGVACCRQQNCCQFVARLLLDTNGHMLPRYRQHVAGNEQHCSGVNAA